MGFNSCFKGLKVKIKVSMWTPCRRIGGSKGTAPLILNVGSRRRRVVNVTPWVRIRYPLNRSPGRLQSCSGHFAEERNLIVLRFVCTDLLCSSQWETAEIRLWQSSVLCVVIRESPSESVWNMKLPSLIQICGRILLVTVEQIRKTCVRLADLNRDLTRATSQYEGGW